MLNNFVTVDELGGQRYSHWQLWIPYKILMALSVVSQGQGNLKFFTE